MKHLFTLLFLVPALCVQAQTVKIGETNYNTIQEAIAAASDGNVINISGAFTENIVITDKSLTLKGSNPATDIIDGGKSGSVVDIYANQIKNITLENLTIRNGTLTGSGGGIKLDTATDGSGSSLTLNNVIVKDNSASWQGGGIASLGANLTLNNCIIKGNSASNNGGGGIIFTTKGNKPMVFKLNNSSVSGNTSKNGGGIYLDGNTNLDLNAEITNTTITGNTASSGSNGAGGGAIWSKTSAASSNVNLKLVHVTIDDNSHTSATKNGLSFTGQGNPTTFTKVEIYNSILVNNDEVDEDDNKPSQKAIDWRNAKAINIVNTIFGGMYDAAKTVDNVIALDVINGTGANNEINKTAVFAGMPNDGLTSDGGTDVLALTSSGSAVDHCTAATTGITLPTVDQRGYTRDATPDSGAYEYGASLGLFDFKDSRPFSVYPNPASQFIHIDTDVKVESVKIYSLLGALEKSVQAKNTVDISNLNRGVHLLVVESNGKQSAKQLIIE
jgi:hypothetical protein